MKDEGHFPEPPALPGWVRLAFNYEPRQSRGLQVMHS